MSIRVVNPNFCMDCRNKNCSFVNAVLKTSFYGLRTETTVCPSVVLTEGPLGKIKGNIIADKACIDCGLCVLNCHNRNLEMFDTEYRADIFENLSTQQYNAIACSYLNKIFDFSANTNRNKSLQFDGYVCSKSGKEAFVQIDANDDSLECVRRLLSDFLLYSPKDRVIDTGIIVLQSIPQKGTRDVFNVLHALKNFPTTCDMNFYFTTFSLLRLFAMNIGSNDIEFEQILLNLSQLDDLGNYKKRLLHYMPNQSSNINKIL